MISTIRNVIIIILTVLLFEKAFAQDNTTIDFFDQIKTYDLSTIITEDSRYDAVAYLADGFSNNQFVGSWTSYKTNISKKCHWGDDRIPESGDLDIGAGEFSVNDKYLKNGWLNYKLANSYGDSNNLTLKNAKLKEDEKWWK